MLILGIMGQEGSYWFLFWIYRKTYFLLKCKYKIDSVVAIKMHNSILLQQEPQLTDSPAAAPLDPLLYDLGGHVSHRWLPGDD